MVVPQAAESWNVLIFSQDCDGATTASKKGFICSREQKRKTNGFTFGKAYKMTVGNYLGTEGIKTRRSVQDQIVGTKKESFHML